MIHILGQKKLFWAVCAYCPHCHLMSPLHYANDTPTFDHQKCRADQLKQAIEAFRKAHCDHTFKFYFSAKPLEKHQMEFTKDRLVALVMREGKDVPNGI